jgi:hypothetical protein
VIYITGTTHKLSSYLTCTIEPQPKTHSKLTSIHSTFQSSLPIFQHSNLHFQSFNIPIFTSNLSTLQSHFHTFNIAISLSIIQHSGLHFHSFTFQSSLSVSTTYFTTWHPESGLYSLQLTIFHLCFFLPGNDFCIIGYQKLYFWSFNYLSGNLMPACSPRLLISVRLSCLKGR